MNNIWQGLTAFDNILQVMGLYNSTQRLSGLNNGQSAIRNPQSADYADYTDYEPQTDPDFIR
jgi:hypothetical protein